MHGACGRSGIVPAYNKKSKVERLFAPPFSVDGSLTAHPQQDKNRNIFVLLLRTIRCWVATARRPEWVHREGRLWRAGARHTAPSLCRLLWLLSCSVQESNILFRFSLRRNAFDAVHHVLFYNAKARCLKQRAFQTVKKVNSSAEVYQNTLHQSLPCVRGGVKNLLDF